MAKQTEKSPYLSRYSPEENYISPMQYIVELICEKKAVSEERSLPFRFWEHEKWTKYYKQQVPAAAKLLKTYDHRDIVKALRDNKAWKTYSLRAPWLISIIEEKQREREAKPEIEHVEHKDKGVSKPQIPLGTQSIINKLRGR